ncbi:hypothetical protein Tco_1064580 [Tanacetum coccineum]
MKIGNTVGVRISLLMIVAMEALVFIFLDFVWFWIRYHTGPELSDSLWEPQLSSGRIGTCSTLFSGWIRFVNSIGGLRVSMLWRVFVSLMIERSLAAWGEYLVLIRPCQGFWVFAGVAAWGAAGGSIWGLLIGLALEIQGRDDRVGGGRVPVGG